MSLIDELTVNAITAVWHHDEYTAEKWFSLISWTFHDAVAENAGNPPDFDQFWWAFDSIATRDHGANVDAFREYLINLITPMDVIADLAGQSRDEVLAEVLVIYRDKIDLARAHGRSAEGA